MVKNLARLAAHRQLSWACAALTGAIRTRRASDGSGDRVLEPRTHHFGALRHPGHARELFLGYQRTLRGPSHQGSRTRGERHSGGTQARARPARTTTSGSARRRSRPPRQAAVYQRPSSRPRARRAGQRRRIPHFGGRGRVTSLTGTSTFRRRRQNLRDTAGGFGFALDDIGVENH